jgi:hypothetical protein
VITTGVHKSEKKEVCGQPAVEARARLRDGSRSRWGALAEQGEAGSAGPSVGKLTSNDDDDVDDGDDGFDCY